MGEFDAFRKSNTKVVAYFATQKCTFCYTMSMEFVSLSTKYLREPEKYSEYKLVLVDVIQDRRFFGKTKF